MKRRDFLALGAAAGASVWARAAEPADADVVVYGATPAGVCAAVAAARAGARTLLLEPEGFVGGIMSAGLGFSDSNQTDRRTLKGLFEEVHLRIAERYAADGVRLPYDVRVKDQTHWSNEPRVAERVFQDMLREAGVTTATGRVLQAVDRDGPRLKALTLDRGEAVRGKVFVDATYEGDLLAAAGVSWKLGREGRAEHGESLAGAVYPKKAVAADPFDGDGRLLPLMNEGAPPPEGAGDARIMTYSFRLCLTADPARQAPIPAPESYDPRTFELARRLLRAQAPSRFIDLYPLPNGKLDGNNGIGLQLSLGLVGRNHDYPLRDQAGRKKAYREHLEYTLGLIHFLRTDPAVPEKIRRDVGRLGLARDEFAATAHLPPMLYVREGRRMAGRHVLTQKDILDDVRKPDAVAVGSFPIDSHDCQRVADGKGGWINEGTIFPKRLKTGFGPPHQIPYRSLLPKPEEAVNLVVPVALSCTHVAFSSVRVEPTWMALGQSAGTAAALAARDGGDLSALDVAALQARLREDGQVLDLPDDVRPAKD